MAQEQMQVIESQPVKLRAVETFIPEYKKLTPQDIKNLDRKPYEDFQKEFRTDPVKVMVYASDLGMDLSQYGNLISPSTFVEQKRSITARLMQDEGLFAKDTELSAASTVGEYLDAPHRTALLFQIMTGAWNKNSLRDRNSIQLPTSSPLHTPPNTTTHGMAPPVEVGTRLNAGELVSDTHSVDTNSYSPFKWDYNKEDMKRNKVKPAETIPASTLGESSGNIPMAKWGNRFVLPYEILTGGQGLRVNKLAAMVALDAAAEMSRQYIELVQILEKGDGVTGAAKVEGIQAVYGATAAAFEFGAFLNWLDEAMNEPFQISHVLMRKAEMRSLRASISALTGDLAIEQLNRVGLGPGTPENMDPIMKIRYGRVPDEALTANYVCGVDARYAIEKVNRSGMAIREQANQIANQTREVVVSDTYVLARLAAEAVKVLNTGA